MPVTNEFTGIDEYLPQSTLEWCCKTLKELGFKTLNFKDVLPSDESCHRKAYIELRGLIREHIYNNCEPSLSECDPPTQEQGYLSEMEDLVNNIDWASTSIEEVEYASKYPRLES